MARMQVKLGEEYVRKLAQLSSGAEEAVKKGIKAGADIVADQVRANLNAVLSGTSSGDLQASMGITPIKQDREGNWNAKVGFDGYGKDGTPNPLKAAALEYGTQRGQPARPFVRPAVTATEAAAQAAMELIIDEEIKRIMKG